MVEIYWSAEKFYSASNFLLYHFCSSTPLLFIMSDYLYMNTSNQTTKFCIWSHASCYRHFNCSYMLYIMFLYMERKDLCQASQTCDNFETAPAQEYLLIFLRIYKNHMKYRQCHCKLFHLYYKILWSMFCFRIIYILIESYSIFIFLYTFSFMWFFYTLQINAAHFS